MVTLEAVATWIRNHAEDRDATPVYGFARATTEEIAAGMGLTQADALKTLQKAARKGLVTRYGDRKAYHGGKVGKKSVGWTYWEVSNSTELSTP